MEYQELDKSSQLSAIKARARDLEQQHFQISLRVDAPGAGEVVNQQDRDYVTALENSLETLREMEAGLSG